MFRKDVLIECGGYSAHVFGEDMEVVSKILDQKYIRKKKWKIKFLPEARCYTFAPEEWSSWFRQRLRWRKGLIECLLKYKHMIFNVRYKSLGMVGLTYYFFCECLTPYFLFISLFIFLSTFKVFLYFILFFVFEFFIAWLLFILTKSFSPLPATSHPMLRKRDRNFIENLENEQKTNRWVIFKGIVFERVVYSLVSNFCSIKADFDYLLWRLKGSKNINW